jgi:hypothetical protein
VRRTWTRALLCAILAAVLGGCAAPGKTGHPVLASEPARQEDEPHEKAGVSEPQTIAAWEARIQGHAATLYALLQAPAGTGASALGPPPRARPYRPQAKQQSPRPTTAGSSQPIRCRRLCRHVRAICYAAKRICQIAARVGGENARAACERNRKRCKSARTVTTRQGCAGCGQATGRRGRAKRRACLARRAPRGPRRL